MTDSLRPEQLPRRRGPVWLRSVGNILSILSALGLILSSLLPWAQFTFFGNEVRFPGVIGWGMLTLLIGVLTLAAGWLRRLPLLMVLLGLLSILAALQAERDAGKAVRRRILETRMMMAPVNARLEQITLPPVEPFGPGIRPARDYVGPGPLYAAIAGSMLALGATLTFVGGRMGRSCGVCGALWREGRAVFFCPACGVSAGKSHLCPVCHNPREPGDHFCVRCGCAA